MTTSRLTVRSHIGRDILQSAQLFQTLEAAIWEYVVNSLQYLDPGAVAQVNVTLDPAGKRVMIDDNAAGMDHAGLVHFFTMHAENLQRRKGIPGRGKFGTGKSAAFGIGTSLQVDTVRNSVRNVVYVDRKMIEAADGDEVPVQDLVNDEPAPKEPNGTTITIGGVKVRMSRDAVIRRIERHLSAFRSTNPVVTVNGHVCEVPQPPIAYSRTFTPATDTQRELLRDVTLTVNISRTPLDEVNRGVSVTVGPGNLVAVVTAGVDVKEYGNRLFGEIDAPELDNPKYDPVAAYGHSRDLRLNPAHPVAAALIGFIGASLERVRAELVEEGRKARAEEETRRLARTANEIAQLLNEDLATQAERLEAMANVRRRTRLRAEAGGEEHDESSFAVTDAGGEPGAQTGVLGQHLENAEPAEDMQRTTSPGGGGLGGDLASPVGTPTEVGTVQVTPAGERGSKRPRGGLNLEYVHNGTEADRSEWDKQRRVIQINLDHPVVVAARKAGDDDIAFRRLSYEIAFTQYALAMADMQYERDEALTASDAMYEVREALRRVWARAPSLYLS